MRAARTERVRRAPGRDLCGCAAKVEDGPQVQPPQVESCVIIRVIRPTESLRPRSAGRQL
jgi:hypothetical protein